MFVRLRPNNWISLVVMLVLGSCIFGAIGDHPDLKEWYGTTLLASGVLVLLTFYAASSFSRYIRFCLEEDRDIDRIAKPCFKVFVGSAVIVWTSYIGGQISPDLTVKRMSQAVQFACIGVFIISAYWLFIMHWPDIKAWVRTLVSDDDPADRWKG